MFLMSPGGIKLAIPPVKYTQLKKNEKWKFSEILVEMMVR